MTSTEDSSSDSQQQEPVDLWRPGRKKIVRHKGRKMPVDVGRLIKWLEVTKVIEPEFDFRAQFITDWDACERRRDAGGFEDDNDISPITDNESSDSGNEMWEVDWRETVKQIKSSDGVRQELIKMRDRMEASRLLNSRLQVDNRENFDPEAVDEGTKQCKRELGLCDSDDAREDRPTKTEGREIFCHLLPHMMDVTIHERDEKVNTWQWDLIYQVSMSASDRPTDTNSVICTRWQSQKARYHNRKACYHRNKDSRKRNNVSNTTSKSKKPKKG